MLQISWLGSAVLVLEPFKSTIIIFCTFVIKRKFRTDPSNQSCHLSSVKYIESQILSSGFGYLGVRQDKGQTTFECQVRLQTELS